MYTLNTKNQTGIFPKWKHFCILPKWKFFYENSSKSCVWVYMVYLSNPPTILSFTFYLKQNLNKTNLDTSLLLKVFIWSLLLFLDLVQTWSNELDFSWVLDAVLMHKLLNQFALAPKLDFKSFVEAKHQLRSWSLI